ncbi:hypothetical protein OGAPHI_000604 [Ogataea philodendri]|uniref:Thioesterase domain-containing protein n=1 Tax=Ogataea philodendri TaxID=1378263 RepID=A0A9P8T920_9ASCO|nr:uncharacterized protein OGAPHI_000604 [Ogataea philodendri]KAH3670893.1 hypothetical protein OGAPHI_000604 [Ogataea philodendri]
MSFVGRFARFAKIGAVSTLSFGAGVAVFGRSWPDTSQEQLKVTDQRSQAILDSVKGSKLYKQLAADSSFELLNASDMVPNAHRKYHVGQGLFNSPKHIAIDPIVFINKDKGQLYCISHFGDELVGTDTKVHNGIVSTLIDEELCVCGFPKLPNKRGVTAQLKLNFYNKVPPNSTVLLKANVEEFRGRKCLIRGTVELFDSPKTKIADGQCVLVEPTWFKYLNWVPVFN